MRVIGVPTMHPPSPTTLGERVRGHRLALGLSQEALAEAADVSRGTVARCESDIQSPRVRTLFAVAAALGCDAGYLWSGGPA